MRSSPRRPTPFASSVLALGAMLALAPRALAAQDEALVGEQPGQLALADARAFDAPAFRAALTSPEPVVRRQAAYAVGRVGERAGTALLLPLLADPDTTVQTAAAFGLGLLRDPAALPALVQYVRQATSGTETAAHAEAVTAIAKAGGDAAAQALADFIAAGTSDPTRPSPVLRRALLESWRLGAQAPVQGLLRYGDAPAVEFRWSAVYSLARLRAPAAIDVFLGALADREPSVRAIAVRALSRPLADSAGRQPAAVTARVLPLVNDADPLVRVNALRAIATFKDSALAPSAISRLTDPDLGVVVQAETTLGLLGGRAAVTALEARATHPSFAVRRQAGIALAMAGAPSALGLVERWARDPDERTRLVAAEALAAAPDSGALKGPLTALLDDRDGRVAAMALQGLTRRFPDDTALVARCRRLLAHGDPAVRSLAADYLARHPADGDVEALAAAFQRAAADSFNDARLSAVRALAAIARLGAAPRLRVASRFLAAVPRVDDYLVRRLAADSFPDAAGLWGPPAPIATGRTPEEYRDVARRYVLPGERGRPLPRLTIETDQGAIVLELLVAQAPLTVLTLVRLAERRYFDNGRWHRVVPNFVVQDGDPRGDGWGGPGYVIRDEINPARYGTGTVGMALSGPDTGGSQFFITHSPQPHLDGTYTVFARVVTGMDAVNRLSQGDRIRSIHP